MNKKKLRSFFKFLIFICIVIVLSMIYLIYSENKKYDTYIETAADRVDFKKVNKNGIDYYQGNYKYIVNKKEYFYTSKVLYSDRPDTIIQIRYNKENPKEVFDKDLANTYLIIALVTGGIEFILILITISISPTKLVEYVTCQVVETVNCVGGKRIYLCDVNIPNTSPDYYDKKYYVYFSNNDELFKIGNILKFNKYKYKEVFTTEEYRTVKARTIYEFNDLDFEEIKKQG